MTTSTLLKTVCLSVAIAAGTATAATPSHEQLIHALFEAFNAHDAKALSALYTDDARVYSPEKCTPTVGAKAIAASYAELFAQVPDVHDELEVMLSDGDRVAVMFTASSQIEGAQFRLPIAAFLRIENGKITEDRAFFQTDMPAADCDSP